MFSFIQNCLFKEIFEKKLIFLKEKANVPGEPLIILVVEATVLLSIFAHGLSANPAIDRYARQVARLGPDAPENLIVSTGAKQAVYNVLLSIVNPQDEVILLAPYWVSYPEMVRMCYGIPVVVTPEDGTFHPRMEDIKASVSQCSRVRSCGSVEIQTDRGRGHRQRGDTI